MGTQDLVLCLLALPAQTLLRDSWLMISMGSQRMSLWGLAVLGVMLLPGLALLEFAREQILW